MIYFISLFYIIIGAEGGTWTHTLLPTSDFESDASANSTTSACLPSDYYYTSLLRQMQAFLENFFNFLKKFY